MSALEVAAREVLRVGLLRDRPANPDCCEKCRAAADLHDAAAQATAE